MKRGRGERKGPLRHRRAACSRTPFKPPSSERRTSARLTFKRAQPKRLNWLPRDFILTWSKIKVYTEGSKAEERWALVFFFFFQTQTFCRCASETIVTFFKTPYTIKQLKVYFQRENSEKMQSMFDGSMILYVSSFWVTFTHYYWSTRVLTDNSITPTVNCVSSLLLGALKSLFFYQLRWNQLQVLSRHLDTSGHNSSFASIRPQTALFSLHVVAADRESTLVAQWTELRVSNHFFFFFYAKWKLYTSVKPQQRCLSRKPTL